MIPFFLCGIWVSWRSHHHAVKTSSALKKSLRLTDNFIVYIVERISKYSFHLSHSGFIYHWWFCKWCSVGSRRLVEIARWPAHAYIRCGNVSLISWESNIQLSKALAVCINYRLHKLDPPLVSAFFFQVTVTLLKG